MVDVLDLQEQEDKNRPPVVADAVLQIVMLCPTELHQPKLFPRIPSLKDSIFKSLIGFYLPLKKNHF